MPPSPASLHVVQAEPFNAEAPLTALARVPTPTSHFYVRSNFRVPQIKVADWRLRVGGAVQREVQFTYDELRALPQTEATVLLECAGNGRRRMVPQPSGVPWDLGAVGVAVFEGVSLGDLLRECGVAKSAVEVAFRGADAGDVGDGHVVHFERSLPMNTVLDDNVLIAWRMNGEPLMPDHGFPARIVVPNWYAVASVKWLTDISVLEQPFTGHFQTEKYRYVKDPIAAAGAPVREVRVRSIITSHTDGDVVNHGLVHLSGIAWSGAGEVSSVSISTDGGSTWQSARLIETNDSALKQWQFDWDTTPGTHAVLVRATDSEGNTQPVTPIYNELGYGNNVVQAIKLECGH